MFFWDFVIYKTKPEEDRDGFHFIFHDPFVVASEDSVNIFTLPNRTTEYFINPRISYLDESLVDFDPEE
jgi:hypothetical protein